MSNQISVEDAARLIVRECTQRCIDYEYDDPEVNTTEAVAALIRRCQPQCESKKIAASCYQLAGMLGAPARVLDALADTANGKPFRDFLPVSVEECQLQWISVEQELAPRHETVEALSSEGEVYQARVCYGMHEPFWRGHSKLNFGTILATEGITITHWRHRQPRPAPPQAAGEEEIVTDTQCQHLQLKKCVVGKHFFYKCKSCNVNFEIPLLLRIRVTYPKAAQPGKEKP